MDFSELKNRALEIRRKYADLEKRRYGREWSGPDLAAGFVGDVGDLMKLVTAKKGLRETDNLDSRFEHELSNCLWSILVLSEEYGVDLEKSFLQTMNELEDRLTK